MTLQKFWSLPTWAVLMLLSSRLPVEHPWRQSRFSLQDWFDGATALCHVFDGLFWLALASLVRVGLLLLPAASAFATAFQVLSIAATILTYFFFFKHFWGTK